MPTDTAQTKFLEAFKYEKKSDGLWFKLFHDAALTRKLNKLAADFKEKPTDMLLSSYLKTIEIMLQYSILYKKESFLESSLAADVSIRYDEISASMGDFGAAVQKGLKEMAQLVDKRSPEWVLVNRLIAATNDDLHKLEPAKLQRHAPTYNQ